MSLEQAEALVKLITKIGHITGEMEALHVGHCIRGLLPLRLEIALKDAQKELRDELLTL
jgi:hypothetical protein